jgi:glycine betaine/choline ABC-type transport system substrate-binding protein
VVVGSKNFTEQFVLGEIYAQSLKAAGYKVRRRLNLGDEQIAFHALRRGRIDAYPEYTSTVLQAFYRYRFSRLPRDPRRSFATVKRRLARDGIRPLPQSAVNDTGTLVMTRARADALGSPRTISGLSGKARTLTFGGFPECRREPSCLLGVKRRYHLRFKRFRAARDPYAALDRGVADVAYAFTTDGALSGGGYVSLRDDRHLFPPYRVTLLFDRRVLAKLGPDARRVVARVQKPLTTQKMSELNARVLIGRKKPRAVATEFLRESGLIV